MARLNTNAELWGALSQFGIMTDSTAGVDTTLSSSAAEGATSLTPASVAGASTLGDYIRVGSRGNYEVAQIESASTVAFTLKSKLAYDHSTGEAVHELDRTDLGDTSDDGVQVEVQADRTRIDSATQRHAYDWNINHTNYRCTVNLENLSPENFLTALGITDDNVHGAGTTADPYVSDWTPDDIDGMDPVHFWARGTRKNGDVVEVQFWNARIDPTKTMTFARGQDAPAALVFDCSHVRVLQPV